MVGVYNLERYWDKQGGYSYNLLGIRTKEGIMMVHNTSKKNTHFLTDVIESYVKFVSVLTNHYSCYMTFDHTGKDSLSR